MRRSIIIAAAFAVFTGDPAFSQTEQGSWELSLSGSFGSVSSSSETSGSFGNSSSDSEAEGYLSLILRPAFYVIDGLAVEPEFLWMTIEGDPPSFVLSGNLDYTFRIPSSPVAPFLLAGYGTGNSIPFLQTVLIRSSDKLDVSVLNIGGGMKIFLAERVAIRTEYRYQRFSMEQSNDFGPYSFATKSSTNFHNILFGLSVFLP